MSRHRLVMTLLVRDEADIIERNICFHLNHGVDFIVATDNGSTDGTIEILEKYEAKGLLALSHVKEHTYEQSKWVTEMAKRAVSGHNATHLFHADADEFWTPKLGNLKLHLPQKNEIYSVSLRNYIPNLKNQDFWTDERYVVTKPYARISRRLHDNGHRYLLNQQNTKIMTSAAHTEVSQGNHFILTEGQTFNDIHTVLIHHFPIRSWEQFKRKVINGGSAYAKNPNRSPDVGWQWKEWYRLYKLGLLENVYRELCINPNERPILQELGVISKSRVPVVIADAIERFEKPPAIQKVASFLGGL